MKVLQALMLAGMALGAGCADVGNEAVEAQSVSARNQGPILAPGERAFGRSYGEWEAAWWQWSMRIPAERDPISDTTGANCAEGQSGPVWFLAGSWGSTVRRECTVPRNKAIYFPIVNQIWSQFLTDPPTTLDEIRSYVRSAVAGAVISVTIDGRPVENVTRYYQETPVFPATFTPGNSWGVTANECARRGNVFVCPMTVDAGYALLLYPLSVGDHTLHFDARLTNGFSLDVSYTLHVR